MKMMKILVAISTLSVMLLLPAGVSADRNAYLSVTAGRGDFDSGFFDGADSANDEEKAFGLNFGYRATENFAFELGYLSMDKVFGRYGDTQRDTEVEGWSLGAVAILPISPKMDVYARLGGFSWERDYVLETPLPEMGGVTTTSLSDETDRGTNEYYGLGMRYNLNETVGVGVEYIYYKVDELGITVLNGSLTVNF